MAWNKAFPSILTTFCGLPGYPIFCFVGTYQLPKTGCELTEKIWLFASWRNYYRRSELMKILSTLSGLHFSSELQWKSLKAEPSIFPYLPIIIFLSFSCPNAAAAVWIPCRLCTLTKDKKMLLVNRIRERRFCCSRKKKKEWCMTLILRSLEKQTIL